MYGYGKPPPQDRARIARDRMNKVFIYNSRRAGGLANRTLLDVGVIWAGVFLFRALDRLKIGVGEGVNKFLVGVAGVLVSTGPDPRRGPLPGRRLSAIAALGDGVGDVLPDDVVCGAGVCRGRDAGVL